MVGNREGPADGAGAAAGGVVRERGRERAEIIVAARREGHRVLVSEIDIGEGDGAASIEIAAVVDVALSVTAPVRAVEVITGASSVPVIVTVTSRVTTPPFWSSSVTV